jgi:hypothetical protein
MAANQGGARRMWRSSANQAARGHCRPSFAERQPTSASLPRI